ncbi:hypothetical protein [Paenibacillus dendritiformis]|uniref:hypothetical protein n=1 Tax=Paenibacillus dendritiformis TaxID=130049 RepID=UPI00387E137D
MAKLNGVVLTEATIEYNGARYVKLDETAKAGDILRVDESDYSYVTEGAYYEVDHVDSWDDPQIIDDDGDEFDGAEIEYTLFRKVSEPQAAPQQYREVNREAKDGERIKIVKPYMSAGRCKKGDELIVHSVDTDGSGDVRIMINGERTLIARKEYVVLEPIAEQPDDIIVVDGVKYWKVDRAPKVGDFAYALKDGWDRTEGSVYEIRRIDSDGDGVFRDDVGDSQYFDNNTDALHLVELIPNTTEDLERQVSELQSKLSEVESELAAKKAEEEAAKRLKVGEYAKVLSKTRVTTHESIKENDIVKVVCDDETSRPFKATSLSGSEWGWFCEDQLIRATDEEVELAKAKAHKASFNVGDYARVVNDNYEHKVGHIVRISDLEAGSPTFDFKVARVTLGGYGYIKAENIEKLSAEEAEEVAKWAAIGRKVGELKDGDLVQFTEYTGAIGYGPGSYAIAQNVRGDLFDFGDGGRFGASASWCNLVAPVESVVNLAVSN